MLGVRQIGKSVPYQAQRLLPGQQWFHSSLVNLDKKAIRFHGQYIHLDSGELASGEVSCVPGEPMELHLGEKTSESIKLPDTAHIALGRVDPHVHFRESATPTPEEHAEHGPADIDYESLVENIRKANSSYSIRSGCLSALKGGVSIVGAMGNTPWGPVGPYRHQRTQEHYKSQSLIPIIVWPRMEPGAAPVKGHEGKDFGSTFGGSGLTGQIRKDMYALWKGEAVSYHNDQARADESIEAFRDRVHPYERLLHHQYFDGSTVLACQKETMDIAESAGVSSLLARHIPTGPALQQILDRAKSATFKLPAEVGLDYMYWNQDRLLQQKKATALINYRRPAHPTLEDQQALIALTLETVRDGYAIFFGSDHAPHSQEAKAFHNGLPGSPGTRNIEHSLQFYCELVNKHGCTWADIDRLSAINPAKHVAQFYDFPYEIGALKTGAMANLAIFDPEASYQVDKAALAAQLEDPEYHSAMTGEKELRGQSLFTVANGRVFQVNGAVKALN
jgi:dihydroorotase-like cyclic amidohydrolase